MNKFILGLLFLALSNLATAQNKPGRVQAIQDTLTLGSVTYPDTVDFNISLFNKSGYPVKIDSAYIAEEYLSKSFTIIVAQNTIQHLDTVQVVLRFHPMHNIQFNTYAVVAGKVFGDVAVYINGQGQYPLSYYNSTFNQKEQQLKTTLKSIISASYQSLGYTSARDQMYGSVDNVSGKVQCIYTARLATFNTRAGANSNNFNAEHVWPQGTFSQNEPMRSDLHNLFSTDINSNSVRGNLPFGIVTGATSYSNNGSKRNSANTLFEPRDSTKGTVARALLYFILRYQNYQSFMGGAFETQMQAWVQQYPPTPREAARNNAIAALQNNRNPFVDYPQFVERITSFSSSNSSTPASKNFALLIDTVLFSGAPGSDDSVFVSILNTGNQSVQLSNFMLNGTGLSFLNSSGQNTSLPAGMLHRLWIKKSNLGAFTGLLTFNTDVSGKANISIPLGYDASYPLGIGTRPEKEESNIWVNGNTLYFNMKSEGFYHLEAFDIHGKKVFSTAIMAPKNETISVQMPLVATGMYVLQCIGESEAIIQKVIVGAVK